MVERIVRVLDRRIVRRMEGGRSLVRLAVVGGLGLLAALGLAVQHLVVDILVVGRVRLLAGSQPSLVGELAGRFVPRCR